MERKLNTRITEMLGIERPILSGAMQWLAKAELVAAVSNAGGLGVMSSATFRTAEDLRAEIRSASASRRASASWRPPAALPSPLCPISKARG